MIYGRDVMLAVRNCLDRDATEKVTETIRLSLPAHLFSLIRRRALPNSALHTDVARQSARQCPRRSRPVTPGPHRTLSRPQRLTMPQTNDHAAADDRPVTTRNSTPTSGKLRIGTINAQSLVPKVDQVIEILERQNLDILCVCETWLHSDVLFRFLLFPGYTIVRRDRPQVSSGQRKRGGGVAIILKQEIKHQVMAIPDADLIESLWLTITWPGGRPSVIGAVYRPPAGSVQRAIFQLEEQLREALISQKPLFLLGDININVIDTASVDTRHYLSALSDLNPRPAGVWLVTRPAGGGGGPKGPPLRSPKLLDRFPNFKRHSIALYVNYPYKVKYLTRRSLMTSQVRSKSEFSTFRAWRHRRVKFRC